MGQVYFVQAEETKTIKIGYTEQTVDQEVYQIQKNCPENLRVLYAMEGSYSLEQYLHREFSKSCKRGKWFYPHKELMSFIYDLGLGNIDGLELLQQANYISGVSNDYIKNLESRYKYWQTQQKFIELNMPDPFPADKRFAEEDFPRWFLDIKVERKR